jgi:uncharacterized protein YbjT (DUF2867 family)
MRVAVAGGTGLLGSMVVRALRAAGHEPVILARATGVDVTRAVPPDRLSGATGLIDVTNVVATRKRPSVRFFDTATRQLLAAGRRAGIRHHVALSIVGVDRIEFGYYLGKRRQEELVRTGPVPATVVRATQFHEFAAQLIARSGPVVLVPRMLAQPVAAREVAELLVSTVTGEASGETIEIGGPEERQMVDMVRSVLAARGQRRLVVPVKLPGAVGTGMAGGALLPREPGPRGTETFEQWLAGAGRLLEGQPGE